MKHFIVCVGILATLFGCGESSISNNSDSRSQDEIVLTKSSGTLRIKSLAYLKIILP